MERNGLRAAAETREYFVDSPWTTCACRLIRGIGVRNGCAIGERPIGGDVRTRIYPSSKLLEIYRRAEVL
jgi:hypothetical protein